MNLIDAELLRECLDGSMRVVLGRVTSATIQAAGTRSRSSVCDIEVLETVCGDPLRAFTVSQYTAAAEPHLRQGATYVLAVALRAGATPPPGSMIRGPAAAVEVAPGEEARAVEAHRQALAALRGAGR